MTIFMEHVLLQRPWGSSKKKGTDVEEKMRRSFGVDEEMVEAVELDFSDWSFVRWLMAARIVWS